MTSHQIVLEVRNIINTKKKELKILLLKDTAQRLNVCAVIL
jgi:hypothetical protein